MTENGHALASLFAVEPPDFDRLDILTIAEADRAEARARKNLSPKAARLAERLIEHNHRFFMGPSQSAYLGSPTQNALAEMAAVHLFRDRTRLKGLLKSDPEDFYRHILETSFGFLGSLLLNPRRKCDLLNDHYARIEILRTVSGGAARTEIRSRRIAIGFLEGTRHFVRRAGMAEWQAGRYIGRTLAKRLQSALINHTVTPQEVTTILLASKHGRPRELQKRFEKLVLKAGDSGSGTKTEIL